MKVQDLIKKLQDMPKDTEVCVMDWRQNLHDADDEPIGLGIHSDFEVDLHKKEDGATTPFISLTIDNDDYKDDGTPDFGSSLCASIERDFNP